MFSNKLIWSIVIICFLLIFIKYLGLFGLFGRKEPFTNKDVEKNALAQLNLVYSSNRGYQTDGIGPEIYVNKRVNKWSEPIIKEFIRIQATQNPDVIFDMDMIQLQATQKEAEELINTGMWPWSKRTQDIYTDAISRSTITKKGSLKSMNDDRTIYNERAILQMIAFNEIEGLFLIHGSYIDGTSPSAADPYSGRGTYGINSGLVGNDNDLIQCNRDKLVRVHSMGNDGITGARVSKISDVDYNQLPTLVKGFNFIKQPCNPCAALNSPADYSCPFSIEKKGKPLPSFAWEELWGLAASPIPELPPGFPFWMT